MPMSESWMGGAFAVRAGPAALLALAADQAVKGAVRVHVAACAAWAVPTFSRWELPGGFALVRPRATAAHPGGWRQPSPRRCSRPATCSSSSSARPLRARGWLGALAIGLQAGGALSNLLDRALVGATAAAHDPEGPAPAEALRAELPAGPVSLGDPGAALQPPDVIGPALLKPPDQLRAPERPIPEDDRPHAAGQRVQRAGESPLLVGDAHQRQDAPAAGDNDRQQLVPGAGDLPLGRGRESGGQGGQAERALDQNRADQQREVGRLGR
jgi:hypothetical protein